MDKKLFRSLLLLITFTVGLVFLVVRFDDLLGMVRLVLSNLTPLFAGLAIAFILTRALYFLSQPAGPGAWKDSAGRAEPASGRGPLLCASHRGRGAPSSPS